MTSWTDEQRQAIHSLDRDLLLSAGAGSGKTAVLVQRVIHIVTQRKIPLDQLLIVTFTNAAAGEMRERIHQALLAELESGHQDDRHLRLQLQLLKRCSIGTLHSFCLEVIRNFFHLLNIDPHFRVLDANDADLLKLELMEDFMEEKFAENHPLFTGLVEMFGTGKDDHSLVDLVLRIYDFIHSQPQPLDWLEGKCREFSADYDGFLLSPAYQAWKKQLIKDIEGMERYFTRAGSLLRGVPYFDNYQETLRQEVENCGLLRRTLQDEAGDFFAAVGDMQWPRLRPAAREADEALKERVKSWRNEGLELKRRILEPLRKMRLSDWHRDMNQLYPYMQYLAELIKDFKDRYQQYKLEKAGLDFQDLEHCALEILNHEQAAQYYRDRFAYIFFDEYQDSNLVQETILSRIKRPQNLFMVGDLKQSIYRFRMADPELFQSKYQTYQNRPESGQKIDLRCNFRSNPVLLEGINYIFGHLMSAELGGVDYTEDVYLRPGEAGSIETVGEYALELDMVAADHSVHEDAEELADLSVMEQEALRVVQHIKILCTEKIYDRQLNTYRPVCYADIVVLLRTTKQWAAIMSETLTAAGIPVYADINQGYFQAMEVDVLMNLLRLIDNKRQDIPLLSVMRSSLGNFSPEDLWQLRQAVPEGFFYEALLAYRLKPADPLQQKTEDFLRRLTVWQDEARYLPLDELVIKIIMSSGYYYYVGSLPGGDLRQANLRLFLERIHQFQRSGQQGIYQFLRYYDNLQSSSGDLGAARLWGENENLVRIMSVHKSKGLEFPIVICAGLGKKFNLQDSSESLLLHRELGLGPRYTDLELRAYRDTLPRLAIKSRIRRESLAEEMRILYVAATRAQNKLIFIGSIKNLTKRLERWQLPLEPFILQQAGNFLDWLGPVFLRHPDGQSLREKMADSDGVLDEIRLGPSVKIRVITTESLQLPDAQGIGNPWHNQLVLYPDRSDLIARLAWQYPHRQATQLPAKLTVSQVTGWLQEEQKTPLGLEIPFLISRPFLGTKSDTGNPTLSPAEKGTAMHFVMQHLDLKRVEDAGHIARQLQEMVGRELLRPEAAELISIPKILAFFASPLGRRVLGTPQVYREIPFNKRQPARWLGEDFAVSDDYFLIQGVIDLFFVDEDRQLVLIDYKTDTGLKGRLHSSHYQTLLRKYRLQLKLYKEALEDIRQQKVKEAYIYFFDLDLAVPIL